MAIYIENEVLHRSSRTVLLTPCAVRWCVVLLKEKIVFMTCLIITSIFTARCYASAVPAMGLCLCPCLRLCLSQVGVLLKRLNVGSHKQHHTILQGLYFSGAKDLREVRPGSPPTGAPNAGAVGQTRRLLSNNRKWYKIDAWFLLKSDRKSYALYRMVTLPMTLSAP